jgi:hypothetical protein
MWKSILKFPLRLSRQPKLTRSKLPFLPTLNSRGGDGGGFHVTKAAWVSATAMPGKKSENGQSPLLVSILLLPAWTVSDGPKLPFYFEKCVEIILAFSGQVCENSIQ